MLPRPPGPLGSDICHMRLISTSKSPYFNLILSKLPTVAIGRTADINKKTQVLAFGRCLVGWLWSSLQWGWSYRTSPQRRPSPQAYQNDAGTICFPLEPENDDKFSSGWWRWPDCAVCRCHSTAACHNVVACLQASTAHAASGTANISMQDVVLIVPSLKSLVFNSHHPVPQLYQED